MMCSLRHLIDLQLESLEISGKIKRILIIITVQLRADLRPVLEQQLPLALLDLKSLLTILWLELMRHGDKMGLQGSHRYPCGAFNPRPLRINLSKYQ